MYYNNPKPINLEKPHLNQTRKYLVQQVQHYGIEFMKNLSLLEVLMYGIHDYKAVITGSKNIEPNIYILVDVNGEKKYDVYLDQLKARRLFQEALSYFKNHHSYVADYCYDSNKTGHLHVIVLKLPFVEKLTLFLQGRYSEMYSDEELSKWFIKSTKKGMTQQWSVLTKDKNYRSSFKEQLISEFGKLNITEESLTGELDFPPNLKNEILRYDV